MLGPRTRARGTGGAVHPGARRPDCSPGSPAQPSDHGSAGRQVAGYRRSGVGPKPSYGRPRYSGPGVDKRDAAIEATEELGTGSSVFDLNPGGLTAPRRDGELLIGETLSNLIARGTGSPAWIRTTIHGSKGRCPTIRRPGNRDAELLSTSVTFRRGRLQRVRQNRSRRLLGGKSVFYGLSHLHVGERLFDQSVDQPLLQSRLYRGIVLVEVA